MVAGNAVAKRSAIAQDRCGTENAAENRDHIIRHLRARLDAMPDERFATVTDPASISERMASLVPRAPGAYGRLIGPVYSTRALCSMWGITRSAVSKKVHEGRLLALKVERGNLFPLFQFDGSRVREDVLELVSVLRPSADPFTIAQWLRTPQPDDPLERTPLELLDAGEGAAALQAARRAAARWAA